MASGAEMTELTCPFVIEPLMLPCWLIGADVGPRACCASIACGRWGGGALSAASINRPRSSSGANIFASTSFRSVKCRTSSFGRAVIASAKCVIAGNISIDCSSKPPLIEPLPLKGREPVIEDRGGLFRVCRKGCALRLEERSAGAGFDVFIVVP